MTKNVWALLLECKWVGKDKDVCASQSIDKSLCYEFVKTTILCVYDLVPESTEHLENVGRMPPMCEKPVPVLL